MQQSSSASAHQLPPPELASVLSPAQLQALASSNDRDNFSPSAVVPGRSSSLTNIDADLLASILLHEQQQLQLQPQQVEQRQPTATISGLLRHPNHQQAPPQQQPPQFFEGMLRGQPGSKAGQQPLQYGDLPQEVNQQFPLPNDLWTLQALAQRRQQQLDSQQPVELAALGSEQTGAGAAAQPNSTNSRSPEDQKPRARDD